MRKKKKSKKPDFVRQDCHKVRLKRKWRRPRGLQSKVRLGFRGRHKKVSSGYRSPKSVRGLHKSGLKEVIVTSLKDIEDVSKKTNGAIISAKLGAKKKYKIVKKLVDKQITILNIKDVAEYLKSVESKLNERKEKRKKLKAKKEKKKTVKTKKKEKLTDKLTEEEKKKEEKKEKDKILTKKE